MVTDSPISEYTVTRAPTWTVPSRTRHGRDHVVTQVTDDGVLFCSCEAGQYGRSCWHREWVKDGRAGKPRIRLQPKPATGQFDQLATGEIRQSDDGVRVCPKLAETVWPPYGFSTDDLYSDAGAAIERSLVSHRAALAS